jgi:hypothetical protein
MDLAYIINACVFVGIPCGAFVGVMYLNLKQGL